jgi:hypothetical protein
MKLEITELRGGYRTEDPRLDRLPSQLDSRLRSFPVAAMDLGDDTPIRTRMHRRGQLLDQAPERGYDGSGCVGFSTLNFLRSSPVRNPRLRVELGWVELQKEAAIKFYHWCQDRDEWPETAPGGEGGTSVDASGKLMKELGVFSEYHWITGGADELARVLMRQPAIMGTWWTTGMDNADSNPLGIATFTGRKRGGHAWLVDGVLPDETIGSQHSRYWFRGFNTWGEWGWHKRGTFWVSAEDMDALLNDQGECMVPTEVAQS